MKQQIEDGILAPSQARTYKNQKKKDNFSLFTIFFLRKDIHTFSFFEINKSKRGNFSSSLMGSSGYLTRPKRCQFGFPFFFFFCFCILLLFIMYDLVFDECTTIAIAFKQTRPAPPLAQQQQEYPQETRAIRYDDDHYHYHHRAR